MAATKACPFCDEEIKAAAVKCKHCGSMLDGTEQSVATTTPSPAAAPPPGAEKAAQGLVGGLVAMAVLGWFAYDWFATAPDFSSLATAVETATEAANAGTVDGPLARVGESVRLGDSVWQVNLAKRLGQTLASDNQFIDPATTDGDFVLVSFKVTNKTSKEERILAAPPLVDSLGREFKTFDGQHRFLPEGAKTIGLEAIPSTMTRQFWGIYEVAATSNKLRFKARELGFGSKVRLVDLAL